MRQSSIQGARMILEQARVGSRIVSYRSVGAGRTLMLLHGFPLNADQWLPQLDAVPAGWRFVALDLRGFRCGDCEDAHPTTMATYAGDVLALMDHLDAPTAAIAGLSMGGYVALELARTHADRVEALVLADTRSEADDAAGRDARDAAVALVNAEGPEAIAARMLPKLLGPTSQRERPELVDRVRGLILSNGAAGLAAALMAMKLREDSTAILPVLTCPTLVACGSEDSLTPPALSEAMARAIPRAELVELEGAGHLSNLEAPGAFNDALGRFLRKLG